jgi:Dockerin type I domain
MHQRRQVQQRTDFDSTHGSTQLVDPSAALNDNSLRWLLLLKQPFGAMSPRLPQRPRYRRLALEFLETRAVPTTAWSVIPTDEHPFDVNNDGVVAPSDVLIIINALNNGRAGSLADRPDLLAALPRIDVNGDGELAPNDALQIIKFLNSANDNEATGGSSFVLPLSQIGMSSAARLANGNMRISQFGTTVSDFNQNGEPAGQITVPLGAGQTIGSVTAVSPNGRWFAGYQQPTGNYNSADPSTWGPVGLWDTQNSLAFHAIDFTGFSTQGWIMRVSDSGVALIGVQGILTYRWDAVHGLTKLTSLADLSSGTLTGVPGAHGWAMSADGSVVVGESGDSNGPHFAAQWTDPTKPQRLPDLGGVSEAWSISLDGRIIGGTVFDPNQDVNVGGRPLAAVWIDGQLKILHDAQGNQLKGGIERVVNGIDGDPNKWVAFGWMSSGSFIAFSGGQVQPLTDWLSQNYSIKLVDDQTIIGAFVDGNRLSLVTYDHRILPEHPCSVGDQELNCSPAFPPLPPEANRLVIVALRDSDFAAPPAVNAAEFGLPLEQVGIRSVPKQYRRLPDPQSSLTSRRLPIIVLQ